MSQSFDITAKLQLQAGNFQPVISSLQQQLGGMKASVNVGVNPAGAKGVKSLEDAFLGAMRSADSLGQSMKGLGSGSGASGLKQMQVAVKQNQKALNDLSSQINTTSNDMFKLGQMAAVSGRRFLAFSLGAVSFVRLAGAVREAAGEAIEFQRNMVRLTQLGAVTSKEIGEISDTITKLSTSLGVSSKELADTTIVLKGAGLSASELKSALEALSKTSLAATFKDIKSTTEGLLSLRAQFNLTGKDYEAALGSINNVAREFAVESEDLIEAVRRSGAAFKAAAGDLQPAKQSLNEFIGLFTSVRATTRESADSIATSFKTIFARLQSNEVVKNLKEMGINLRYTRDEAEAAGQAIEGQFVGGYKAVQRISAALKDVPTSDARFSAVVNQIGGIRQISKVIPLLTQTSLAQKAYGSAIAGTTSLTRDADKSQEAFAVRLDKLRETFSALVREISQSKFLNALADSFLVAATYATNLVRILTPLIPLIASLGAAKIAVSASKFVPGFVSQTLNPTRKFATGGVVRSKNGGTHSDNVHTNVAEGSFVIRAPIARKLSNHTVGQLTREDGSKSKGVPVSLMDGEVVVPPGNVRKYGRKLYDLNKGFSNGVIKKFAEAKNHPLTQKLGGLMQDYNSTAAVKVQQHLYSHGHATSQPAVVGGALVELVGRRVLKKIKGFSGGGIVNKGIRFGASIGDQRTSVSRFGNPFSEFKNKRYADGGIVESGTPGYLKYADKKFKFPEHLRDNPKDIELYRAIASPIINSKRYSRGLVERAFRSYPGYQHLAPPAPANEEPLSFSEAHKIVTYDAEADPNAVDRLAQRRAKSRGKQSPTRSAELGGDDFESHADKRQVSLSDTDHDHEEAQREAALRNRLHEIRSDPKKKNYTQVQMLSELTKSRDVDKSALPEIKSRIAESSQPKPETSISQPVPKIQATAEVRNLPQVQDYVHKFYPGAGKGKTLPRAPIDLARDTKNAVSGGFYSYDSKDPERLRAHHAAVSAIAAHHGYHVGEPVVEQGNVTATVSKKQQDLVGHLDDAAKKIEEVAKTSDTLAKAEEKVAEIVKKSPLASTVSSKKQSDVNQVLGEAFGNQIDFSKFATHVTAESIDTGIEGKSASGKFTHQKNGEVNPVVTVKEGLSADKEKAILGHEYGHAADLAAGRETSGQVISASTIPGHAHHQVASLFDEAYRAKGTAAGYEAVARHKGVDPQNLHNKESFAAAFEAYNTIGGNVDNASDDFKAKNPHLFTPEAQKAYGIIKAHVIPNLANISNKNIDGPYPHPITDDLSGRTNGNEENLSRHDHVKKIADKLIRGDKLTDIQGDRTASLYSSLQSQYDSGKLKSYSDINQHLDTHYQTKHFTETPLIQPSPVTQEEKEIKRKGKEATGRAPKPATPVDNGGSPPTPTVHPEVSGGGRPNVFVDSNAILNPSKPPRLAIEHQPNLPSRNIDGPFPPGKTVLRLPPNPYIDIHGDDTLVDHVFNQAKGRYEPAGNQNRKTRGTLERVDKARQLRVARVNKGFLDTIGFDSLINPPVNTPDVATKLAPRRPTAVPPRRATVPQVNIPPIPPDTRLIESIRAGLNSKAAEDAKAAAAKTKEQESLFGLHAVISPPPTPEEPGIRRIPKEEFSNRQPTNLPPNKPTPEPVRPSTVTTVQKDKASRPTTNEEFARRAHRDFLKNQQRDTPSYRTFRDEPVETEPLVQYGPKNRPHPLFDYSNSPIRNYFKKKPSSPPVPLIPPDLLDLATGGGPPDGPSTPKTKLGRLAGKFGGLKGLGGIGATVAANFAPQAIEYATGSFESAGSDPNARSRVRTGRAIGGTIQGAANGAAAGFAVGGPLGAAVGGLAGAIIGYTTSIKEADKEVAAIDLAKTFKSLDSTVEAVANGRTKLTPEVLGNINSGLSDIDKAESKTNTVGGPLLGNNKVGRGVSAASKYVAGFFTDTSDQAYAKTRYDERKKFLQENVEPRVGSYRAITENIASGVKVSPNLIASTDANGNRLSDAELESNRRKRLAAFEGAGGAPLANKIVEATPGLTHDKFDKEIDQIIVSANKERQAHDALTKAITQQEIEFQKFGRISAAVDAAVASMGNLQHGLDATEAAFNNSLQAIQVHSNIGALDNPTGLDNDAHAQATSFVTSSLKGRLTGPASDLVDSLGDTAKHTNTLRSALPDIINQAHGGGIEGEGLVNRILSNVGDIGKTSPDSEGTIPSQVRDKLANSLNAMKPEDLAKNAGENVQKLVDDLMKGGFANINDVLKEAAQKLEENANNYNAGLIKNQDMINKIGESQDKQAGLQVTATRSRGQLRSAITGDSRYENISYRALTAPIRQRQERLTGLSGAEADNPELIASNLRQVRGQITDKISERDNAPNQQVANKAAEDLAGLQSSAQSLRQALDDLAEPTEKNAILQDKLNRIEESRNSKLSFTEKLVTASPQQRVEMRRNAAFSDIAFQTGHLAGLNPAVASGALSHLDSLGEAELPAYGGAKASDVKKQLLVNTAKIGDVLTPNEERNRVGVIGAQANNNDRAVQAQAKVVEDQGRLQGDFFGKLQGIQNEFFNKLGSYLAESAKKDITAQIGENQGNLTKAEAASNSVQVFRGIGVTGEQAKAAQANGLGELSELTQKQKGLGTRFHNTQYNVLNDTGSLRDLVSQSFSTTTPKDDVERKKQDTARHALSSHLAKSLGISNEQAEVHVLPKVDASIRAENINGDIAPEVARQHLSGAIDQYSGVANQDAYKQIEEKTREVAVGTFGGTQVTPEQTTAITNLSKIIPTEFQRLTKALEGFGDDKEIEARLGIAKNKAVELGEKQQAIASPPVVLPTTSANSGGTALDVVYARDTAEAGKKAIDDSKVADAAKMPMPGSLQAQRTGDVPSPNTAPPVPTVINNNNNSKVTNDNSKHQNVVVNMRSNGNQGGVPNSADPKMRNMPDIKEMPKNGNNPQPQPEVMAAGPPLNRQAIREKRAKQIAEDKVNIDAIKPDSTPEDINKGVRSRANQLQRQGNDKKANYLRALADKGKATSDLVTNDPREIQVPQIKVPTRLGKNATPEQKRAYAQQSAAYYQSQGRTKAAQIALTKGGVNDVTPQQAYTNAVVDPDKVKPQVQPKVGDRSGIPQDIRDRIAEKDALDAKRQNEASNLINKDPFEDVARDAKRRNAAKNLRPNPLPQSNDSADAAMNRLISDTYKSFGMTDKANMYDKRAKNVPQPQEAVPPPPTPYSPSASSQQPYQVPQNSTVSSSRSGSIYTRQNASMASSNKSTENLGGLIDSFDKSITNFGTTLSNFASVFKDLKIPETIKVERDGQINVVINGGQLLAALTGDVSKLVQSEIMTAVKEQLPNMIKDMPAIA